MNNVARMQKKDRFMDTSTPERCINYHFPSMTVSHREIKSLAAPINAFEVMRRRRSGSPPLHGSMHEIALLE